MLALVLFVLVAAVLRILNEGVNLEGLRPPMRRALPVIVSVVREVAATDTIFTAGVEPRGSGNRSLHPWGLAVDFTFIQQDNARLRGHVVRQLKLLLGPDYDIVDEVANPSAGATGPHIHVEHDP